MTTTPNILLWDIETGFNVATVFNLYPSGGRIPHSAIQNERYIICAAFKELHSKNIFTVSLLDDKERFKKDPTDDYSVVKAIHEILSKADVLIAHYGDNFDIKFFNSRCIFHGFDPLPNIVQKDTCKMAKSKFLFNSNTLDYIAKFLGIGTKIKVNHKLWLDCYHGKVKAVKEMLRYNKHDVHILEEVYKKLAPFTPSKLNYNHFTGNDYGCPLCGSTNIIKRGFAYSRALVYQRYQCKDCGHPFQSRKAIPDSTHTEVK